MSAERMEPVAYLTRSDPVFTWGLRFKPRPEWEKVPLYTADQILAAIEAVRAQTCVDPFDGWDAALDALLSRMGLNDQPTSEARNV